MPPSVSSSRFPPPWRTSRIAGGWLVTDAHGRALVYVYGSGAAKGVSDQSLTLDEARRIATAIARLPELLGATASPTDRD